MTAASAERHWPGGPTAPSCLFSHRPQVPSSDGYRQQFNDNLAERPWHSRKAAEWTLGSKEKVNRSVILPLPVGSNQLIGSSMPSHRSTENIYAVYNSVAEEAEEARIPPPTASFPLDVKKWLDCVSRVGRCLLPVLVLAEDRRFLSDIFTINPIAR